MGVLGVAMLVAVFVISLTGLIVASVAMNKTNSKLLVNPDLQQALLVGGTPTIEQFLQTSFGGATIKAGSNDSAGSIKGAILAPVAFSTFFVKFSSPFRQAPKTVVMTPANPIAAAQQVYVIQFDTTGFSFGFNKIDSQTTVDAVQYYYLVL